VTAATGTGSHAQQTDTDDVSASSTTGGRTGSADPDAHALPDARALPDTGFRGQAELGLGLVLLGGGIILVGATRLGLRTVGPRRF
jgi:hypothetical protein